MQLLHMDISANVSVKDTLTDKMEVKERKSSDASLLLMNPVASGDNVTTGLNSTHKLKEDLPPLVPCCEGKELQLLHMDISANVSVKDTLTDKMEVKERKSSDASLLLMNPVASGDNVTTGLNSTHKLKEDLPPLVPCCEGKELQINEDLVRSGLSAISVKHDSVIQCLSLSRACERMQVPPGLVKHRNSFRCLHRPDLKRVSYLRRMTPDELETLFRGYADLPIRGHAKTENRDGVQLPNTPLPPDENGQLKDIKIKEIHDHEDETRSATEDVPAGMRLHGARARLYTSVLAGAKAGDQLDATLTNEELDIRVPIDSLLDDEVQLNEELQIILPPRCEEPVTVSSITTTSIENSISS